MEDDNRVNMGRHARPQYPPSNRQSAGCCLAAIASIIVWGAVMFGIWYLVSLIGDPEPDEPHPPSEVDKFPVPGQGVPKPVIRAYRSPVPGTSTFL